MQRIVNDDGGAIIPLFLIDVMAVNDKLGLPEKIGNAWELDGMKNAERWWFA
jgi:peptide/nickel transport system substrate-binding protein